MNNHEKSIDEMFAEQAEMIGGVSNIELPHSAAEWKNIPAEQPTVLNHIQAGESPASINSYYLTPSGSNVQITLRAGVTLEMVGDLVGIFLSAETSLIEAGWLPKVVGQGAYSPPVKRESPSPRDQAVDGGKAAGAVDNDPFAVGSSNLSAPPNEDGNAGPYGPDEGDIHADYFIVTPKPGDKALIEFWRNGRQWPELPAGPLPAAVWAKFFADVIPNAGPEYFSRAMQINQPVVVHWAYARNDDGSYRMNQKGTRPYKNVKSIRRAE